MNKVFILFLLLSMLSGKTLLAQDSLPSISVPNFDFNYGEEAPAWLLRNLGRAARIQRRLSEAFFLLTNSLARDPENPETFTELALSYLAGNDLHQAQEYLNRALLRQSRLSSPDQKYFILYKLAEIYSITEDMYREYEKILLRIVADDEEFSSEDIVSESLRRNIQATINTAPSLASTSLDQVIILYRIGDSFSLEAHIELGRLYVHSGRYNEAQLHLVFAVVKIYSRLIQEIRNEQPLYSFTGSKELFNRISDNEVYVSYLRNSGFGEALYYLGAASYGFNAGQKFLYQEIWQTLQYLPYDSIYIEQAASRLRLPQREKILYVEE